MWTAIFLPCWQLQKKLFQVKLKMKFVKTFSAFQSPKKIVLGQTHYFVSTKSKCFVSMSIIFTPSRLALFIQLKEILKQKSWFEPKKNPNCFLSQLTLLTHLRLVQTVASPEFTKNLVQQAAHGMDPAYRGLFRPAHKHTFYSKAASNLCTVWPHTHHPCEVTPHGGGTFGGHH